MQNRNNRGAFVTEQNKDSNNSPDEGSKKEGVIPVTDHFREAAMKI